MNSIMCNFKNQCWVLKKKLTLVFALTMGMTSANLISTASNHCSDFVVEPGQVINNTCNQLNFPTHCYATEVIEYKPGNNNLGQPVIPERRDSTKALGPPDYNNTHGVVNFVTLGFGGHIILKFEYPILNGPGPDLLFIETTWGNNNNCALYPEKAEVYASQDNITYYYIGMTCLDGVFDLDNAVDSNGVSVYLPHAQYFKILDISDPNDFSLSSTSDGIEVDGLQCLNGSTVASPDGDGSINLNVSGGNPPYVYQWSTGDQTVDINELGAGIFSVTVLDAITPNHPGCSESISVEIIAPDPLEVIATINHPTCPGINNGSISVTVTGGTPPYHYNWVGLSSQNTTNLTNIGANDYNLLITDANGCETFAFYKLEDPEGDFFLDYTVTNASCLGQADGSLEVLNVGCQVFVKPLTYYLGKPDGTVDTSTTAVFTGLTNGDYELVIKDVNGYQDMVFVAVGADDFITITIDSTMNVTCHGGSDGSVYVSVDGCAGQYTLDWNGQDPTQLSAGTYTVTATDINGSFASKQFVITHPSDIQILLVQDGNKCSVNTTVNFGVQPYTYSWVNVFDQSFSANTKNLQNVPPGVYQLTVTDAKGCIKQSAFINLLDCTPIQQTSGCTNPDACNYVPNADTDDGSCVFDVTSTINETICDGDSYEGYTTSGTYVDTFLATNGCDSTRTLNLTVLILGCTDQAASNYNPNAACDDGTCIYPTGCTDPTACNYNPNADIDDGSCLFDVTTKITETICDGDSYEGYTASGTFTDTFLAANGCDSTRTLDLTVLTLGCTDKVASNYDPSAGCDDGTCIYPTLGCIDPTACNFNPNADTDDGSCKFDVATTITEIICEGDSYEGYTASGTYIDTFSLAHGCDSTRTLILKLMATDCRGDCGGSAYLDDCGLCVGGNTGLLPNTGIDDCGVCYGNNTDKDDCGICFGNNVDKDDCGICFGNNADKDDCGVCFGNQADKDCNSVCFGTAYIDDCGDCVGGTTGFVECEAEECEFGQDACYNLVIGLNPSCCDFWSAACQNTYDSCNECGNDGDKISICRVNKNNTINMCVNVTVAINMLSNTNPSGHFVLGPCSSLKLPADNTSDYNLKTKFESEFNVYPNPFSNFTNIEFSVIESGFISLELYDMRGSLVESIFTGDAESGIVYNVIIDGKKLTNGVYTIRLVSQEGVINYRIVFSGK